VLAKLYLVALAAMVLVIAAALGWAWTTGDRHAPLALEVGRGLNLPTQASCRNAPGWWGMSIFLLADAALFGALVFGYFYLWLRAPEWPPAGMTLAADGWVWLAAAALIICTLVVQRTVGDPARSGSNRQRIGLLIATMSGLVALGAGALAQAQMPAPTEHAFAAVSASLAAFAGVHLALALIIGGFVLARISAGFAGPSKPLEPRIARNVWQYASAIGLLTLAVAQLFPRLV
jgi:cytochrome c oxidase subunit I+III